MEYFVYFLFLSAFSVGIALWANKWGRKGIGWFFLSFFVSPLLTAIILAICGKKKLLEGEIKQ